MNSSFVDCPSWLADLMEQAGGTVKFSQFMNWALNYPSKGYYSSGKLCIGKKGDFVTSPSLGPEFCDLLTDQIYEWIEFLDKHKDDYSVVSIVDIGPGEGDLSYFLLSGLKRKYPFILRKIELVLVEINQGMMNRQKSRLAPINDISIRWTTLEDLSKSPVKGILIAHEILDALPVDRITWSENKLYLQGVKLEKLNSKNYINFCKLPLPESIAKEIDHANKTTKCLIPPPDVSDNWTSEWHSSLSTWLFNASLSLNLGCLLIIDYALEAHQYYKSSRLDGTLLSYKSQKASNNILETAGYSDITAHLCLEILYLAAKSTFWEFIGERKQGLALLSLGLAEKISSISYVHNNDLSLALNKRENLLRLVDPSGLGDFRWILFQKGNISLPAKFLSDPINID